MPRRRRGCSRARGGSAGRPLHLLSRDDEGRPERAIGAAEKLAGRGNRYFFRISSLAGYARPMTGFVESGLGARRVAVLYSPTPGATLLARRQREAFGRVDVRVLVYEPLAAGLTHFGPLLRRVGDQAADVLVSNTFFADHLVLVRQMAQGGIRLRAFLGAFGMEFPDVIRSLGPAAEGLYGTTAWQPGIASPGQEAAARRGRPLTGPGLRDALVAADVMTPMGRVRFDERGDPVSYERVILQIQDGRHVVVWPKERAQAAAR